MSYGIIRVQKLKLNSVRGIQSHDHRERESRTNPDIDYSRSNENFALVECTNYRDAINTRLATLESQKAVRKDAVVMTQFIVTSDKDFFQGLSPDKQKEFFKQSLKFIANRYGEENIISAVVHMDEKTPHMHVNMTPIRNKHLTAKTIFNRTELINLQTDFAKLVGNKWGLKRGISKEEKRKHLSTEEYKIKTRKLAIKNELNKLDASPLIITSEDIKPKKVGILRKESPSEVACRIQEKVNQLNSIVPKYYVMQEDLQKKTLELSKAEAQVETLEQYRKIFADGLSKSQIKALQAQAQEFRVQNRAEAQKARQRAEEREKKIAELRPVVRTFIRVQHDLGWSEEDKTAQLVNEWFEKWDKAAPDEKAKMEKTVKDCAQELEAKKLFYKYCDKVRDPKETTFPNRVAAMMKQFKSATPDEKQKILKDVAQKIENARQQHRGLSL